MSSYLSKKLRGLCFGAASVFALASAAQAGPVKEFMKEKRGQCSCSPNVKTSMQLFMHGRDDNFASPTEPVSPRAGWNSIQSIAAYNARFPQRLSRPYDDATDNKFFIDTISISNAKKMQGGWIIFKLRGSRGSLVGNDSISIGDALGWNMEVQSPTGLGSARDQSKARVFYSSITPNNNNPGLLDRKDANGQQIFNTFGNGVFYADLSKLILKSADYKSTTNVLEQIKSDGLMDFLVQDDTGVDFVAIIACMPRGRTGYLDNVNQQVPKPEAQMGSAYIHRPDSTQYYPGSGKPAESGNTNTHRPDSTMSDGIEENLIGQTKTNLKKKLKKKGKKKFKKFLKKRAN